MVTSQKYTLLPLEQRTACSHAILFKSANKQEIDRIREEIMFDLQPDQQDALLKEAWKEPYSFLFIAICSRLVVSTSKRLLQREVIDVWWPLGYSRGGLTQWKEHFHLLKPSSIVSP